MALVRMLVVVLVVLVMTGQKLLTGVPLGETLDLCCLSSLRLGRQAGVHMGPNLFTFHVFLIYFLTYQQLALYYKEYC